jgi:hypothetical protein
MQISYPASRRGVEIARIPSGAVASMLENEATKNMIFFDDFTGVPFVGSHVLHKSNSEARPKRYQLVAGHLSQNCQNSAKSDCPEIAACENVLARFS